MGNFNILYFIYFFARIEKYLKYVESENFMERIAREKREREINCVYFIIFALKLFTLSISVNIYY